MIEWTLTSWQQCNYEQAINYPDFTELNQVVGELSQFPPIVSSGEIQRLKMEIARAGRGEAFILQGGDCAESFAECRSDIISNKLKILLQMSMVLLHEMRKPIIRIGRIAGQYTKPRSMADETIDGVTLPSYRGDLVNCPEFSIDARRPNPQLMIQGYHYAAITLNFIRALLAGGFADLHHPKRWDLNFATPINQTKKYCAIADSIAHSMDFLNSIDGLHPGHFTQADFYTSHEALNLHYEQAFTRFLSDGRWYNLSTHLPWIGLRTAKIDSAHLELLRGVDNPIGIKVGPNTQASDLKQIIHLLNPKCEEGRILLISRMGAKDIASCLPPLIQMVKMTNVPVTWSCDPMHGNTEITQEGIKTRHFDTILSELKQALRIHQEQNSHLGGVHFELSGENVSECLGGAQGLTADDLKRAYHTLVDPRLNYEQSLEMAIQLGQEFKTAFKPAQNSNKTADSQEPVDPTRKWVFPENCPQ